MESMQIADLIEIMRMNEAMQQGQLQMWLTVTFATIVAAFMGHNLLTKSLRLLVSGLYLVASTSIFAFSQYLAMHNLEIQLELASRGYNLPAPYTSAAALVILVTVGVCSTLYFVNLAKIGTNK